MLRLLLVMAGLNASYAHAQETLTLNVGVREDAASMAIQLPPGQERSGNVFPGPLERQRFSGYMVFVCDQVLLEMQLIYGNRLEFEVVPIKSVDIFQALEDEKIDIVCGPTTATKDRLDGRISSPPVFVSGVTFATRPPTERHSCSAEVGFLGSTTTNYRKIIEILAAGEWPAERGILSDFISGNQAWKESYKDCPQGIRPIKEFDTHVQIAKALCADEIRYYVGDYEIITQTLRDFRGTNDPDCDFTVSERTFSEERYVILGATNRENAETDMLVGQFFEILSRKIFFQPSLLDAAFSETFPVSEPSRKLGLLFWALRGNVSEE